MPRFTETLYYTYIQPIQRQLLVLFLLIIFGVAAYYGYVWYAANNLVPKITDDIANANRRDKTADIYFFSVDWCPHCKTAKPEWDKFVMNYDGKEVNGFVIKCNTVNATNDDRPEISTLLQKFGVEHYPTLKMVVGGKIVEFKGKILETSLVKFMNAMAN
jgi:thiol-disulfide isomerase/thioredoxin